jgi:hypothetical protein
MFYKLWFGEECSELLDKREHVTLQWLQNRVNLYNERRENSRHFRNKKRKKNAIKN